MYDPTCGRLRSRLRLPIMTNDPKNVTLRGNMCLWSPYMQTGETARTHVKITTVWVTLPSGFILSCFFFFFNRCLLLIVRVQHHRNASSFANDNITLGRCAGRSSCKWISESALTTNIKGKCKNQRKAFIFLCFLFAAK